ncbi:MAG: transglycosylase SLT domain-containing protein [Spirochaetaceae bacterium]|jgi:membrane-bound lytic murein transglycosylase D|nr:transglycosylase SLT domain-containing protein [Spirochaetaceae bacterium]
MLMFDKKLRTAVVLQARLDSSRLPSKALLPLAGKPAIQRVMEALTPIKADEYALACPEDCVQVFSPLACACGFRLVTGSKDDVLDRYVTACRALGFDNEPCARIIRATGDNPFVFADAASAINEAAIARNADYAAYAELPYGAGVESIAVRALLRAGNEASAAAEREHVCPYIYGHPEIFSLYRPAAPDKWRHPELRLTIDNGDDYRQAFRLAERARQFWEGGMSGEELIETALSRPSFWETSPLPPRTKMPINKKPKIRRSIPAALTVLPALLLCLNVRASELPASAALSSPEINAVENTAPDFERPLRSKAAAALPPRLAAYKQEDRSSTHETESHAEAPQNEEAGSNLLPAYPLPGLEHPLTQSYIQRYTSPALKKWIESTLKAGEPYIAFIRDEIEKRGMPPYLLYLPVIESGFKPQALSSSGASGLWQFMRNSIKPYMRINDWVDERRDFYKSTHAALSKLEAHYREFGDWHLALAAYNSGGGEIARVIKQTGIQDYWKLNEIDKLKKETSVYVPKLLAVYHIVTNPRRFGLNIDWSNEVYEWELIPIPRQVDITLLAEYAGLKQDALRTFNRELLNNVTPPPTPDGKPYELKVRKENAAAVRAALEDGGLPLIRLWRVEKGDTLYSIARRNGVTVGAIAAKNGMNPEEILSIGRILELP